MNASTPKSALVVGCGDIGLRISARLHAQGVAVTGWVRTATSAGAVQAAGHTLLQADLDARLDTLPAFDAVYYCAPPPTVGATDPRLRALLTCLPVPSRGLLYISTSGVYGNCGGRWIDEAEPLKASSERGLRRLDAEFALRAWAARSGARTVTLRVPGIYGPGRMPVARLQRGDPVVREANSPFTNRIHADDLAEAALLVHARGEINAAYNISDGQPTTMTDYILRCARLLGVAEPPSISYAEAQQRFSPMLRSFLEESKRLKTDRLRGLGFVPRYANLAAGLPSCV